MTDRLRRRLTGKSVRRTNRGADLKVEYGKIEGDLEVSEEFRLHGMVTGTITVLTGGLLELHGMCVGDLLLAEGSTVVLNGMVMGDVTNDGGDLSIFGMIEGGLNRLGGTTSIDQKAVIKGTIK